jgi:ADP-heptose:LPS heptosyltransferase
MTNPKFSVSVLAYQNIALTKRCLASVMANSKDFELILTDNGCKDGTADYFDQLARENPEIVTVFHNPKNEGFIEPNRRAFGLARGKYLVLLNNDTVVPAGWLETLCAPFSMYPDCALSGPAGACCQLRADFHGEAGPRFEYLEGSCLMIDIEKVRPLEPNLFPPELVGAYGEDSYLSLRVRSAGHSIQRVPILFQHVQAATSAIVPQCREWQANNHAFLQKRFARYMKAHRFNYPIIIRRAAAWGDVLLTTPIIRALKERNSMCNVQVETVCQDVFNGNPDVSYVGRTINVTSADTDEFNLNGMFEMQPGKHIVDVFAETVGLKKGEYSQITKLYPAQGDLEWAKRTITGPDWVAIHPGPTSWRCKNWHFDRWQMVIEELHAAGKHVVLVGNDAMPPLKGDLDLRAKTTMSQLAAILGQCSLFVGVDSFPIHAAQAMGTPVVGLFGITLPSLLLTEGSAWFAACSPPEHLATGLRHKKAGLTHIDHPDNPMDYISVDSVNAKIREALCTTRA